jgi:hypothetical protein
MTVESHRHGAEAAELLGISERTFRHWRDRHRDTGPSGLDDRRLAPSLRRAPMAEIERMLGAASGRMRRRPLRIRLPTIRRR